MDVSRGEPGRYGDHDGIRASLGKDLRREDSHDKGVGEARLAEVTPWDGRVRPSSPTGRSTPKETRVVRFCRMAKQSAGLLMYRRKAGSWEVLLVHPGGPFWARKDQGAWTIPKGEIEQGEDAFDAALREFEEETGCRPQGSFVRCPR